MSVEPRLLLEIFDKSPLGMAFISSTTGEIIEANGAYCTFLKRERNQIIGKKWMVFTHPDDITHDFIAIRNLQTHNQPYGQRFKRYLNPDGSYIEAKVLIISLPKSMHGNLYLSIVEDHSALNSLTSKLEEKSKIALQYRDEIFNSLIMLASFRNRETGGHLKRTSIFMRLLLEKTTDSHAYSNYGIQNIAKASMLHDIGKIGIPDAILDKPCKLSYSEFEIIKSHTILGAKALIETSGHIPQDSIFLVAKEIAEHHHEKWDGSGYPHGLKGQEISYISRIMAIIDVYDALRSHRPYKEPCSHQDAIEILESEANSHFDPEVVHTFLTINRDIEYLSKYIRDESIPI